MAEYNVVDPDDLIECPYEKSHMIRAKRFQYHLMKCRKNYVGRDYATCPFNARHEMPKPELRYHIANCADKVMIAPNLAYEKSKQGEGTYFKGNTDVPDYDNFVPESEENWEEEIPSVPRIGVDPSYFARLDNSMMSGLTPREKRAMKNQYFLPPEERRLDSHLQNEYEEEESEEKEEKLRLPQSAPKTYLNTENKSAQQPSTVFAYSLSMAGIGRGQPAHLTPGSTNPDGGRVPEINRYNDGLNLRGRGGRGVPLAMRNPVPSNPANMNDVFSMGIGRGRGLMGMPQQGQQPGFVMPHLGISSSSELLSESTQNGSKEQDYKSSTESESSELADLMSVEKERKKLQKKLRQIEQLESKEGKLSKEEMEKVRLKQDILDRLQRLN